jgi:hypothetical protein
MSRAQQLYHVEFEDYVVDIQEPSFKIDDGRTFSTSSDISEIKFGKSDTSRITDLEIVNGGLISNEYNMCTFENIGSNKIVSTTNYIPVNHMLESSEAFEDDTNSMVMFLESSRHNDSVAQWIPTKVRGL